MDDKPVTKTELYEALEQFSTRIESKIVPILIAKIDEKIDELALATASGFREVHRKFHEVNLRFDQMDLRFDRVERRIDTLEHHQYAQYDD